MDKNVICIKWGTKFGADYVNRLYRMVEKNLSIPHRFVCFTDNSEGFAFLFSYKPTIFKAPFTRALISLLLIPIVLIT